MFEIGAKFGKLTLVAFHGRVKSKKTWLCKCECGNSCLRVEGNLKTTKVPHCGCSPAWKGTNKKFRDLTGMKFGKLTVIAHYGKNKHSHNLWYCECECGGKSTPTTASLEKGAATSCGCVKLESMKTRCITHGGTGTRLYKTYRNMLARCYNENEICFKDYGGRGIKVSEEWKDFSVFKEWAENNGYKSNLTIDRINVNGDYEPNNCRWSTREHQANNKRNNVVVEYLGEYKTLSEWSKKLNLEYRKLVYRYNKGIPFEEIIKELKTND